jgi:hypothetical protein
MVKSAYPPLDSLFDLACRDGVDIRPTLLRVLTDLYVQKPAHSAAEETQYVELALGLVDAVDAPTRAVVTARLAGYRGAPQAVLRRLQSHQPAAAPEEPPIAPAAKPVRQDLIALFFMSAPEERRLILTNLDVAADPRFVRPMTASAEVILQLECAALAHNADEFSRLLERALGIGRDLAGRIVHDYSGEPIVVAAKALGMKAAVLQRVLLFLNPAIGQSVARVYELANLFDEITSTAATYMVSIWRNKGERARTAHAPLYWNDEQASARSLASPAARRVARSRDEPSRVRLGGR